MKSSRPAYQPLTAYMLWRYKLSAIHLSCFIMILRMSLLDIALQLATWICSVFYSFIVEPVGRISGWRIIHSCTEPHHRSHIPRGSGIPGRHNNRRASKRSRARRPPYRPSCIRQIRVPRILETNSRSTGTTTDISIHDTVSKETSTEEDHHTNNVPTSKNLNIITKLWRRATISTHTLFTRFIATATRTFPLQCRSDGLPTPHGQPRSGKSRSEQSSSARKHHTYVFLGKPRSDKKTIEETISDTKDRRFLDLLVADSGAGCSIVSNKTLLDNIRHSPDNETMTIHCNSGTMQTSLIGDLPGYGTVWYNPDGIANIISLGEAAATHRITMDSSIDDAIFIHKPDGSLRRFQCTKSGIYCCNLKQSESFVFNSILSVEGQKQQYSALDIGRATKARKLQETMGFISEQDLLRVVDNNLIRDSKVRRRDVLMAQDIFGPNTNVLKGKTTRKTPAHVREDTTMDVPRFILDRYSKNVTLCADVMHVNGTPFFIAISKHIKHISLVPAQNMNKATMLSCIDKVVKAYHYRGFEVTRMQMDNAFRPLKGRSEMM